MKWLIFIGVDVPKSSVSTQIPGQWILSESDDFFQRVLYQNYIQTIQNI